MPDVILVRHTAVAAHWTGRCYGQSDVGLSADGRANARRLAKDLAEHKPSRIISSPLRRARFLSALVSHEMSGLRLEVEPRVAECDFGSWEGRTWDDIYRETGDAMMGMVNDPEGFRPGGDGETTFELRNRVVRWFAGLPREETVLAVCHGGPIGALVGTLHGLDVRDWPRLIPPVGGTVVIAR
jgi:broad specificity phosphatase PhoE